MVYVKIFEDLGVSALNGEASIYKFGKNWQKIFKYFQARGVNIQSAIEAIMTGFLFWTSIT